MDIERLMTDNTLADDPELVDDVRRRLFGPPPLSGPLEARSQSSADPEYRGFIGASVAIAVASLLTAVLCTDSEPLRWHDDPHAILRSIFGLRDAQRAHVEAWREATCMQSDGDADDRDVPDPSIHRRANERSSND